MVNKHEIVLNRDDNKRLVQADSITKLSEDIPLKRYLPSCFKRLNIILMLEQFFHRSFLSV